MLRDPAALLWVQVARPSLTAGRNGTVDPRKVDLAPVVPLDEESSRALRRATYSRIFPLRPSTTG